jgi:endonuclease/exonuclease/phosphatase family metal-dependent hydrolase
MRVLTWNLFHGRAVPDRRGSLLDEFGARLASWEWDVALLQEVPPWWPAALGHATGASARAARTSRNAGMPARRAIAVRDPGLMGSWGGGANAILVRGLALTEHHVARLRWRPERRVVHGVRLENGVWVSNVHAQAHLDAHAWADLERAAAFTVHWAGSRAPSVLGGDFNLHARPAPPGFAHAAGHYVDHVVLRGLERDGRGHPLERGDLSDHAPLWVDVRDP